MSKQYFVNRQMYYYSGEAVVEIADELDHAGADMLGQVYGQLGEFSWYDDPREAVVDAIKIQKAWQADEPSLEIGLAARSRFWHYLGGECEPITRRELGQWAVKEWKQLPKCARCGDVYEEGYTCLPFPEDGDYIYCSDQCADMAMGDANVEWDCPKCGADNLDNPYLTAVPLCGECDEEFDWQELEEQE